MPKKIINIPKEVLETMIGQRMSFKEIAKTLQHGEYIISRCAKAYGLKSPYDVKTPEGRANLSAAKREWLSKNPERHQWKSRDKFRSPPCERLKQWLKDKKIDFISEYQPMIAQKRYYSIDIAFPDKKIGIEVNGNMHYDSTGKLKPYYQERHDNIENMGWKLYEIHFSTCYVDSEIERVVLSAINSEIKLEFDYSTYIQEKNAKAEIKRLRSLTAKGSSAKRERILNKLPKEVRIKVEKTIPTCPECGVVVSQKGCRCPTCAGLKSRKVEHPSREELEKLVWTIPTTHISKRFGVSDKAIDAWCKRHKISKPTRGYWMRIASGQSPEEAKKPINHEPSPPRHILDDSYLNKVKDLLSQGMTRQQIAKELGFHRQVVGKFCKKHGLQKFLRSDLN